MQSSKSSPAVPKLACLIACLSALRTWVETLQGGFVVIVIGKQTRVGVAGLSVGFLCLELEDLERQWFFGIHISVSSWRSKSLAFALSSCDPPLPDGPDGSRCGFVAKAD